MVADTRKRGRPRKGNELKSETLAIKTSPALKERLAQEARVNRRSLTEEVETRLTESLERSKAPRSERTARLLEQIAVNIFEIEAAIGPKDHPRGWHENIATWAAVREMLYHGPIVEVATSDAFRDAKLDKLNDIAALIREEKGQLVMGLGALGLEANATRLQFTLGDLIKGQSAAPNRTDLRITAGALEGLTDHQRTYALAMIDRLEQLDGAEQENDEARAESVEHLREGIEKGRETYSKPPRNPALDHALHLLLRASFPVGGSGRGKPNDLASSPVLRPRKPR